MPLTGALPEIACGSYPTGSRTLHLGDGVRILHDEETCGVAHLYVGSNVHVEDDVSHNVLIEPLVHRRLICLALTGMTVFLISLDAGIPYIFARSLVQLKSPDIILRYIYLSSGLEVEDDVLSLSETDLQYRKISAFIEERVTVNVKSYVFGISGTVDLVLIGKLVRSDVSRLGSQLVGHSLDMVYRRVNDGVGDSVRAHLLLNNIVSVVRHENCVLGELGDELCSIICGVRSISIDILEVDEVVVSLGNNGVGIGVFKICKVSNVDRTAIRVGQVRSEAVAVAVVVVYSEVGLHMTALLEPVSCDTEVHCNITKDIQIGVILSSVDSIELNSVRVDGLGAFLGLGLAVISNCKILDLVAVADSLAVRTVINIVDAGRVIALNKHYGDSLVSVEAGVSELRAARAHPVLLVTLLDNNLACVDICLSELTEVVVCTGRLVVYPYIYIDVVIVCDLDSAVAYQIQLIPYLTLVHINSCNITVSGIGKGVVLEVVACLGGIYAVRVGLESCAFCERAVYTDNYIILIGVVCDLFSVCCRTVRAEGNELPVAKMSLRIGLGIELL